MMGLEHLSLIYATRKIAAIDGENLSGDEAALGGSEVYGGSGDFFDLAKACHRRAQNQFVAAA
jgi:hypothetical protein